MNHEVGVILRIHQHIVAKANARWPTVELPPIDLRNNKVLWQQLCHEGAEIYCVHSFTPGMEKFCGKPFLFLESR